MFEEKTYQNILADVLEQAPAGVDVRQGSIFYDAVAATCFKLAQYYADLSTAFDLVFLTTAVDEYLDQKGAEYDINRNPATPAQYEYLYEGVLPPEGTRFFTEGLYFVLRMSDDNGPLLEAEIAGTQGNDILPGTRAVPVNSIPGLIVSSFGARSETGVNTEDDESYRQRIREKVSGPAENGNRQHYKTWCEEIAGVGRARIIPLWNGPNTVMDVLIGADGTPAAESIVERVQDYVDPNALGNTVVVNGKTYNVGDGLGDGKANLGAHFTAVAAEERPIIIAFDATLAPDVTLEQATIDASTVIIAHLKDLALNTPENEPVIVRISTIGALLYALPSLIDYSNLTLDGAIVNVEPESTQVAVLGEVEINETV